MPVSREEAIAELERRGELTAEDRAKLGASAGNLPRYNSPGLVAGEFLTKGLADNALAFQGVGAELGGNLLAGATAGARTVGAAPRLLAGGENPLDFYSQAYAQEQGRGISGGLRDVREHTPDSLDILATMEPGDTAANREHLVDNMAQMQEEHPTAALIGQAGADVATLLSGRAPLARYFRDARLLHPPAPPKDLPPTYINGIKKALQGDWAKALKRGGTRVGEAGLEGAVIAALNDNDPVKTAMYSAATQAGGSMALQLVTTKTGGGITAAALALTSLHQVMKSATPGGLDRILESIESSYNEITAILALGALAGIAGSGRIGHRFPNTANYWPEVADSITAIPRGTLMSYFSDISDPKYGNREALMMVMEKIGSDPDYFGPTVKRRMLRATEGKGPSPRKTFENLLQDRKFSQSVDELYSTRKSQEAPPAVDPAIAAADQTLATLPSAQGAPGPASPNPLGVPGPLIDAAVSRAEGVPQGQPQQNAETAIAKQTARAILRQVKAADIPGPQKAMLIDLIGDPEKATAQTLMQVRAALGGGQ